MEHHGAIQVPEAMARCLFAKNLKCVKNYRKVLN